MVEITLRTTQGRLLLGPSPETTPVIAGVIGRAQRLYSVEIHAIVAMGNHLHLLISPQDAQQMARFMGHVASNIARRVGALAGWEHAFWSRRYRAIVVSNEHAAQIARLRYLLAHGTKEGLVGHPQDWPGVHACRALLDGSMRIQGTWFDGTAAYRDRLAGRDEPQSSYETEETIELAPLPCWRQLCAEAHEKEVHALLASILAEAPELNTDNPREKGDREPLRLVHPHAALRGFRRSPAPTVHAATRRARMAFLEAYRSFSLAFREAALRLQRGDRHVVFPLGSFPPAMPFVSGQVMLHRT